MVLNAVLIVLCVLLALDFLYVFSALVLAPAAPRGRKSHKSDVPSLRYARYPPPVVRGSHWALSLSLALGVIVIVFVLLDAGIWIFIAAALCAAMAILARARRHTP